MRFTRIVALFITLAVPFAANAQWTQMMNGLSSGQIECFVVSGTYLFALTGSGVNQSTDNGQNWTAIDTPFTPGLALAVSGTSIFATASGSNGGVFRSLDNGKTWTPVNTGFSFVIPGITGIRYHFVNAIAVSGTTLFAGTEGGGVFRSINNGKTWIPVNTGLRTRVVTGLTIFGRNLYAGTEHRGIFRSRDNGRTWIATNKGLTGLANRGIGSLAVADSQLFTHTGDGVFRSGDNGETWTAVNSGLTSTNVSGVVASGSNLFAATYDSGVFLSTNKGSHWTPMNTGLTNTRVRSIAVSGANLLAGTEGGDVRARPLSEMTAVTSSGTERRKPPASQTETQSQTMEGTVIAATGTKFWRGFKIESDGKEYTFVTEYKAKQGTNPTVAGGKCCDIGARVRVTYIGSITRYLLNVTRIDVLGLIPPEGDAIVVFGQAKPAVSKSKPLNNNVNKSIPLSAKLSGPKILWANDCDPRTSPNYCQISDSLAILSEFYNVLKSVNGTVTYHVPNSKLELAPYSVVILDFCFGAANDNSINIIKQYIREGGSAFIMGGNFCVPDPANKRSSSWYASQLTKDFGVTFTSDDDYTIKWADSIEAHPVTLNVNRIYIGRHAYLNVASPSRPIFSIKGRPIGAIYDGIGSFVALSNENFEWGANGRKEVASSDNFVFWQNALKWLIGQSQGKRLTPRSTSQPGISAQGKMVAADTPYHLASIAAQTATKEIGRYRYIPDEKPDGKIHNPLERRPQMFGTITLTDIGITVSGEQPGGSRQPGRCNFYDSPAATLGRSNTRIRISWNESRDVFSVNGYGCNLQFQNQQERDRFFVDFTRAFQEWKAKYNGFQFADGKLIIDWPCTRGQEAAPCADSSSSNEKPVFQTQAYKITVESMEKTANKYIASLVFENLTNEPIKIGWEEKSNLLPDAPGPYLMDDKGQKYFAEGPDSANIITSSFVMLGRPAEIGPKAKLISRFVFSDTGDGKIFNLEARGIEWPVGKPITIEGLKVTSVSEEKSDSPKPVTTASSSVEPLSIAVLSNPESIVKDAFNAYRNGNSGGVSTLMSEQGMSNSDLYCEGAAMNCLKTNYAGAGELKTIQTRVLTKTDSAAEIVLQTTWSFRGSESRRCQTYQLDMTKDGWRITFFDVPQSCSE